MIVSLTSFPPRIRFCIKTIKSVLCQLGNDDKVVLNLKSPEFPNGEADLPSDLLALLGAHFEINWWPTNIRSFAKLIPSLVKYPDVPIITVDDDIIYPAGWFGEMVSMHRRYPRDIIARRAHIICFEDNKIAPYRRWMHSVHGSPKVRNLIGTGCAGILYPPRSLADEVIDESMFMALCPKADDVWFWAMAVLNGTWVRTFKDPFWQAGNGGEAIASLAETNVCADGNDVQLGAIMAHYPSLESALDKTFTPNGVTICGSRRIWQRNRISIRSVYGIPYRIGLFTSNYMYEIGLVCGVPFVRKMKRKAREL